MTLKLMAVRIPEKMHTYLKIKAVKTGQSQQQLVQQIFHDFQSRDTDYLTELDKTANSSLKALSKSINSINQATGG